MNKTIVFDMDGTLANFYGVKGWLDDILSSNIRPYLEAEPMFDVKTFNQLGSALVENGYSIKICSWLPDKGSKEYCKEVRQVKKDWLNKYIDFELANTHIVKYGYNKHYVVKEGLLFDDNNEVINKWLGKNRYAIKCENDNIDHNNFTILNAMYNILTGSIERNMTTL